MWSASPGPASEVRAATAESPGMDRWDPPSAAVVVVYEADRSSFDLGIVLNSPVGSRRQATCLPRVPPARPTSSVAPYAVPDAAQCPQCPQLSSRERLRAAEAARGHSRVGRHVPPVSPRVCRMRYLRFALPAQGPLFPLPACSADAVLAAPASPACPACPPAAADRHTTPGVQLRSGGRSSPTPEDIRLLVRANPRAWGRGSCSPAP